MMETFFFLDQHCCLVFYSFFFTFFFQSIHDSVFATSWSHSETSSTAPPCKFNVSSVTCLLIEMLVTMGMRSPLRLHFQRLDCHVKIH